MDWRTPAGTSCNRQQRFEERRCSNGFFNNTPASLSTLSFIREKKSAGGTAPAFLFATTTAESTIINGNSTITSNGTLNSCLLKVAVNDEAKFDIKSFGKILVEADESIDVNFEEQNKQQVLLLHIDSALLPEADLQMDAMLYENS